MAIEVVLDFETASACDLKAAGAHRYAEDPTTEILCLTYSVGGSKVLWLPGAEHGFLGELVDQPEAIFVAHNAAFEKAIWRHLMVPLYDWPNIPNNRWHCTLAQCAMKSLPQDLDRAVMVLRLSASKDREGSKLTKGLSKPDKRGSYDRSSATMQRVYDYCRSDVDAELVLHHRIGWMPAGERNVWLLDQRINERGVRLDLEFVSKAQQVVDRASVPLVSEFAKLTGLKPTQGQKFLQWMLAEGVELPNLTKETVAKILGETEDGEELDWDDPGEYAPELPDRVHRALSIRQLVGSASVKKLKRMEQCVNADGRARGLLQYHGTGPGRWAGRLFQPQNFARGTLKLGDKAPSPEIVVEAIMSGDPEYVEMVLGYPPIESVVSGLRHCLVPDRGRLYVAGDFAGIQARTVLALAGQHDKTAIMAAGADIYCDMASAIYKRPIDKRRDPEERQTGKNSVLGLGFQMGWSKFKLKYAQEHTDEFCKLIVNTYRQEWAPGVPKVWYALERAAVDTVWEKTPHEACGMTYALEDGWLTVRLPSGRKIWYFNPQAVRKAMPWDETDVRKAFTYQAMKMGQWKTIEAFGGLLTENVVMGMERDLLTHAMFKCEKNGFPLVLNNHDELLTEPLIADADEKALAQIMEDVPEWSRHMQIPVAVEAWKGDRYRK